VTSAASPTSDPNSFWTSTWSGAAAVREESNSKGIVREESFFFIGIRLDQYWRFCRFLVLSGYLCRLENSPPRFSLSLAVAGLFRVPCFRAISLDAAQASLCVWKSLVAFSVLARLTSQSFSLLFGFFFGCAIHSFFIEIISNPPHTLYRNIS